MYRGETPYAQEELSPRCDGGRESGWFPSAGNGESVQPLRERRERVRDTENYTSDEKVAISRRYLLKHKRFRSSVKNSG